MTMICGRGGGCSAPVPWLPPASSRHDFSKADSNTPDDTDPVKGHPGYQGDDVDQVAAMLPRVGSDRFKLLFDIYRVQVMNGDVLRRIGQMKDIIGLVDTADCPGRGKLSDAQELRFAPTMRKLIEVGDRVMWGRNSFSPEIRLPV